VTELMSLHPPSRGARARSTQGWRCELAWINAVAVVPLRAVNRNADHPSANGRTRRGRRSSSRSRQVLSALPSPSQAAASCARMSLDEILAEASAMSAEMPSFNPRRTTRI